MFEYLGMVLGLLCGLALFLYGMDVMGEALKKSAGSSLKTILGKMTSNPAKGFLLGLVVTMVIQSSSATTVMVVGFVNSGTMTLLQAVGVIIGANVGTAVTAWLTATNQLNAMPGATDWLSLLKPDTWMPVLAVIGIVLTMMFKRGRKKDVGTILLGFAVLMTGMSLMSDAVGGLGDQLEWMFTMFNDNPFLGVIAGVVLTAIVQSSSASVGILQALTSTGAITFGGAIPIVMGQNIGTCVTALLSSMNANKNGKRAALVHLYFNVIGVVIVMSVFYILNAIFSFVFIGTAIDAWGVALVHTLFKILCTIIIGPFYKLLAKLACLTIKDKKDEDAEKVNLLDERLLETPSVAVDRALQVTCAMAGLATKSLIESMSLFESFDSKLTEKVREDEGKVDNYEDSIGSYLVKVAQCDLNMRDSEQVTKLLHIIGDYERISDHAVNIVESAEEIKEKKLVFSPEAQRELSILRSAVHDILLIATEAFENNDLTRAAEVEPLEQVIDDLRDKIKLNHIIRLQKSECSIDNGFILSDLLTNFERVADHCSNIAGCVIEISAHDALDMHKYLADVKQGSEDFEEKYKAYSAKYAL